MSCACHVRGVLWQLRDGCCLQVTADYFGEDDDSRSDTWKLPRVMMWLQKKHGECGGVPVRRWVWFVGCVGVWVWCVWVWCV